MHEGGTKRIMTPTHQMSSSMTWRPAKMGQVSSSTVYIKRYIRIFKRVMIQGKCYLMKLMSIAKGT